jgi:hypothetical protein
MLVKLHPAVRPAQAKVERELRRVTIEVLRDFDLHNMIVHNQLVQSVNSAVYEYMIVQSIDSAVYE